MNYKLRLSSGRVIDVESDQELTITEIVSLDDAPAEPPEMVKQMKAILTQVTKLAAAIASQPAPKEFPAIPPAQVSVNVPESVIQPQITIEAPKPPAPVTYRFDYERNTKGVIVAAVATPIPA